MEYLFVVVELMSYSNFSVPNVHYVVVIFRYVSSKLHEHNYLIVTVDDSKEEIKDIKPGVVATGV